MNDSPTRVLVIDDLRTMRFPAIYARTTKDALVQIAQGPWDEVWFDHDLGPGQKIMPIVTEIERRAYSDDPIDIGRIFVHTSNPAGGDQIVAALERHYRVVRVAASVYEIPRR